MCVNPCTEHLPPVFSLLQGPQYLWRQNRNAAMNGTEHLKDKRLEDDVGSLFGPVSVVFHAENGAKTSSSSPLTS